MKKKITAIALVICLLAVAVVGGTLAYFTDEDEVSNVFTMGNVDIVLDEAKVTRDGDVWVAGDERVQENKYEDIFPGAVLPKDPTVHNVGTYGAYVRAVVTIKNGYTFLGAYAEGTATDEGYAEYFEAMVGELGEGWTVTKGLSSMDYLEAIMGGNPDAVIVITYDKELAAGESTPPIFENVNITTNWTQDSTYVQFVQENGFVMDIVAQAVQADGFTTVDAAFAASFDAEE